MNVNGQQSSNGKNKKGRMVQPSFLNYNDLSDKIGIIKISGPRNNPINLSRSKRKIKIKPNKGKKGTRKPGLLDKLNTKKNRELAGDVIEELVDDDGEDFQTTEMPLEQLNLELIKSVRRSNLNKVTEYINKGADVNTKDNHGQTPLHIASKRGYLDIGEVLVDKGAIINAQEDKLGQEPLHLAAAKGHLDIVKYLVEKGADVDVYQGGGGYSTPLHFAARKSHFDVVKYLTEQGANPYAKDGDGKTARERAEQKGISDIAEYLKVRERKFTEVPQITERQQVTTETLNVTTEIQNVTTEIQNVTTEIQNVTTNISQTAEGYNSTEGQQVSNTVGNGSIHSAAGDGDLNAVKYFVENGTDVNIFEKGEFGETPLLLAVRFGRLDVVKYLVEKGADVNLKGGYLKNTPLHEAVGSGSLEIVKYLIEKGADINGTNKSLDTPLHRAAYNGKFEIAKYLVDRRANLRAVDESGNTPLHEAARDAHFGIFKYIADIEYDWSTRAEINAQNNDGETPLHIAVRKGSLSIVKYLVQEKHAYTYRQDKDGNTPLHLAVKSYNSIAPKIASFLVEQGANLEIRNKNGQTPIELSYTNRWRRDLSNNSWMNRSVRIKDSISSSGSPGLLTSREHNNHTVTAMPEINTTVLNNTIILGILAAALFNKTECNNSIHENLLSPRQQLMRNIDDSRRVLSQSLQKCKEEGWDGPDIDVDDIEFSGNNTGNAEK